MGEQKQYVQLSVFDRLNNGSSTGVLGTTMSDIHTVRESVFLNVENLLNTRRIITKVPENYQYLKDSLFTYGLEDFVAKNPKTPAIRRTLKRSIESVIKNFEPRLIDVVVGLSENYSDPKTQSVCFTVRATLFADPIHEPIHFDTWFSVNRGEYTVKRP